MFKSLAPACLAFLLAAPVCADEVWIAETGRIVYLADEYGAAVLSFTDSYGAPAEMVFPGLAGNFTDRGVHHGYWIGQGDMQCAAGLGRPGAAASLTWGRAIIAFDSPGFPSAFTVLLSSCDEPPNRSLRADPLVGAE